MEIGKEVPEDQKSEHTSRATLSYQEFFQKIFTIYFIFIFLKIFVHINLPVRRSDEPASKYAFTISSNSSNSSKKWMV
jgi:hypothetical protein